MAIDPYASCPCGSGKKLKFCCGDLATDLDKIQRMIEGDQPRAAIGHLEKVLAKSPGRGSLLDIKATIELSLDEREAAARTIQQYLDAEPDNPASHSLAATLAAAEAGTVAVEPLQDALERVSDEMPRRVLQAIGAVGHALLIQGALVAARAHLWLYHGVAGGEDMGAMETLVKLNQVAGIPLLLRDQLYLQEPPIGVAWEAAHDQAQLLASRGQWRRAAALLDQLVADHPDEAGLQYNAALVSGWLGRDQRFVAGMRQFAQLTAVESGPTDEAIEAEAIAQLVDRELRDEPIEVVRITHAVADEETLIDRLTRDDRTSAYQLDESELAAMEGPPPRHTMSLLDRPLPATGEGMTEALVPRVVGFVSYYGRQTDREERLELVVDRDEQFDATKKLLAEITEGGLGEAVEEVTVGESPAAEAGLSIRWQFPVDTPMALRQELLATERKRTLLDVWPEQPRAVLAGKTAVEAGGDESLRLPLAAAVLNLEQGSAGRVDPAVFAELRDRVGLAPQPKLAASELDAEMTPLVRLPRFDMSELDGDQLVLLYRRARLAGANELVLEISRVAVERPANERLPKEELYERLATLEPDPTIALAYVDQARRGADAAGHSNAAWDLAELELRVVLGDMEAANQIIQHVRTTHLNEPGVAERLYRLLYALGAVPAPGEAPPQAAVPGAIPGGVPGAEGPQPATQAGPASKIWTPGDDAPAESGGQKLWTPS